MDTLFSINPQLDIPIYQQLVDQIRAAAKRGDLTVGQQLPTVQDVSCNLGIAKGTIKRAYDELARDGFVEKIQGRGTFVRYRPQDSASRKEQAMAAIDEMLDSLEAMGFSPAEIGIYLDLKMRQRAQQEQRIRVAVVECNTENLARIFEQLRHIPMWSCTPIWWAPSRNIPTRWRRTPIWWSPPPPTPMSWSPCWAIAKR